MDPAGPLSRIGDAISKTVPRERLGVAFSGGVDSSLLAKMCADMGYDITLLTVGFAGSHDLEFARKVNTFYGYRHETAEITKDSFLSALDHVDRTIKSDNISWIENSIAFYHASRLARDSGIRCMVTANGADELFCGYDAYRRAFDGGTGVMLDMIKEKICNENAMLYAIGRLVSGLGVRLFHPLLHSEFVEYAMTIPIHEKISGPHDMIRKHILRQAAARCGVPSVAYDKRKKALQYGTRIHRALVRSRKTLRFSA